MPDNPGAAKRPQTKPFAQFLQEQRRGLLHDASGLSDGAVSVLDHLLPPTSSTRPIRRAGAYTGPVPDELRDWIAVVRANLDRTQAEQRDGARS